MKIFVKSYLVLARKLNSVYFLKVAYFFAIKKNDALSCYYIACRYFATNNIGFDIILDILVKYDLSLAEIALPILEGYLKEDIKIDDIKNIKFMVEQESKCYNIDNFSMLIKYVDCFLNKDFILSYKIWKNFDDVSKCLSNLKDKIKHKTTNNEKIAVILPGTSEVELGKEIDKYNLVGRTSFQAPAKESYKYSGSRLDYAFLNNDRYIEFLKLDIKNISNFPLKIISNVSCKKINAVNLKNPPILELEQPDAPICSYSFITLLITHWCLEKAFLKPYFYNGDFYLSDKIYENGNYDLKEKLTKEKNIIDSYLLHDVFFVHASLRILYQKDLIGAKGALKTILEMSGIEFAEALNRKWNKNISI